jgi:hypothetical protein
MRFDGVDGEPGTKSLTEAFSVERAAICFLSATEGHGYVLGDTHWKSASDGK